MFASLFEPDDPASPEVQRQIDEICDEFEAGWQPDVAPDLAPWVNRVESQYRPRLFAELLRQMVALGERDGATTSLSNYTAQFPEYAFIVDAVRAANELTSQETQSYAGFAAPETSPHHGGPSETLPIGTLIDRYCILEYIGGGSFGHVYRAKDTELHREVALKVCRPHRATDEYQAQFQREARILATLQHPHIIRVYDAGIFGRQYFVVSELVQGRTLEQLLDQGPLEPERAARIVAEIAEALAFCHPQELVHRDVKPSNVLLDAAGKAYLADFGIALTPADFSLQKQFVGTPSYMSPEQVDGDGGTVDGRSDIFSLGVVLYRCLTGKLPYRSQGLAELRKEIVKVPPPPPRQSLAKIPPRLESICLQCLAKSPTERYSTAGDLAQDLRSWLEEVNRPSVEPVRRRPPAAMLLFGMAAVVAAVVIAFAVFNMGNGDRPPQHPVVSDVTSNPPTPKQIQVQHVELHVQRDPASSQFETHLLIDGGQEQAIRSLEPLDNDDQLVLFYHLDPPAPWRLIHVDPEGGSAIVAKSELPVSEVRVPTAVGRGVAFRAEDPKGINLLLLVSGELPSDISESDMAAAVAGVDQELRDLPVRWSQLRAGFEEGESAIQLPQDYLHDIENRLPEGVRPMHALFLRTVP